MSTPADPLADALVASPHWEYAPRFAIISIFDEDDDGWHPTATVTAVRGGTLDFVDCNGNLGSRAAKHCRPDIDDPANHGHMLGLVRKAWGDDYVYVCLSAHRGPTEAWSPESIAWVVRSGQGLWLAEDTSYGLALAAALLAAPVKAGEP